jgi:hypothetical protein
MGHVQGCPLFNVFLEDKECMKFLPRCILQENQLLMFDGFTESLAEVINADDRAGPECATLLCQKVA